MTRALSAFFWCALLIGVSLTLYGTSYRVEEMSKQLHKLNTQIEAEQVNIHVLKAEWVYLANPARIETAARKYLAMNPTALKQIATLQNLSDILPTRNEAMAGVSVEGKPIANVDLSMKTEPKVAKTDVSNEARGAKTDDGAHVNTRMIIQSTSKGVPLSQNEPEDVTGASHIILATAGSPP